MIRVEHGDCREIIPTLGVTVDAVVTDPPYHLTSGNLAIDWSAYTNKGATKPAGRKAGFMGQQWDGGDIAFRPETCMMRPGRRRFPLSFPLNELTIAEADERDRLEAKALACSMPTRELRLLRNLRARSCPRPDR